VDITKSLTYEQDYSIKELPSPIRDLLIDSNLPWLNSLAYCTSYNILNPADRVFIQIEDDQIQHALFYRLKYKLGFRVLEIEGFPDAKNDTIEALIKLHKAHVAIVNRLENPVKTDENWYSTVSNIYLKSYITIATLPTSKDEYLSLLGKNKKKQLPQYLRRLYKHFDEAIEIRHQSKGEIKLEEVIQLELLNRERRATKGKGVDSQREIEERQKNLMPLIESSGFMLTIRNNGKIIGGTLNFIHGKDSFMLVTGHDSANDNLRIGFLGIWKTIEYLIDNGIGTFNFLWGRKPYKTQFLGVEYPWSIHIISTHKWLAILWKYQISMYEFYLRGIRFLKTRLSFFS
jgi:Acetyltransferase (GNAT) domain